MFPDRRYRASHGVTHPFDRRISCPSLELHVGLDAAMHVLLGELKSEPGPGVHGLERDDGVRLFNTLFFGRNVL